MNDAAGIFRIIDAKFDNKNGSLESNSHIDLWSPKKIFSVPCKRNSQERKLYLLILLKLKYADFYIGIYRFADQLSSVGE